MLMTVVTPDAVKRPSPADRAAVEAQIAECQVGPVGVEVSIVCRQLHGSGDLVANDVDGVEVVSEADEVLVVAQIRRAASVDFVVHGGWAGYEAERHPVTTDVQRLGRVSGCNREFAGSGGESCLDDVAADTHDFSVDDGTSVGESLARLGAPHLDA
jgi:hypothetical protein